MYTICRYIQYMQKVTYSAVVVNVVV
jgi:hypothetical protein